MPHPLFSYPALLLALSLVSSIASLGLVLGISTEVNEMLRQTLK